MAITRAEFPLPDVDDELTAGYFAGAARGELVHPALHLVWALVLVPGGGVSRVRRCARVDGDRGSGHVVHVGRGGARVPSRRSPRWCPFVTALVALEEDPAVRIVALLVDVDRPELAVDLPMEVVFRPLAFPTVPDRSVVVPMFTVASSRP